MKRELDWTLPGEVENIRGGSAITIAQLWEVKQIIGSPIAVFGCESDKKVEWFGDYVMVQNDIDTLVVGGIKLKLAGTVKSEGGITRFVMAPQFVDRPTGMHELDDSEDINNCEIMIVQDGRVFMAVEDAFRSEQILEFAEKLGFRVS